LLLLVSFRLEVLLAAIKTLPLVDGMTQLHTKFKAAEAATVTSDDPMLANFGLSTTIL